jgi:hypothetical protein
VHVTPDEIASLFAPHILARRTVFQTGKRLVHYTSAEAAYRIISGKQIWLRNAQMMNDFSEIQHGINCLIAAWVSPKGLALQEMLNRIKEGLRDELAQLFDGHAEGLRIGTFITALSEHEDDEDELGRLSMWRAYGGRAGVALVLNNTAVAAETDEMHVFSSPVFYQDIPKFVEWFQDWAAALLAAEDKLHEMGADDVRNWLFTVFRSFALCTKHPGFAEEREWRVFYSPIFEGASDWIEQSIEIVHGMPQHVMKLHLKDDPEKGITGVAPLTLLNRVIIGPCDNPIQIRASIGEAMQRAGIENPLQKTWMSLIPLRHGY